MTSTDEPLEKLLETNRGEREQSSSYVNRGDLWRDIKLILGLMLTYDKRLEKYLRESDELRADNCSQYIKNAPGNKSQQLVFCYYLQKSGLVSAFVVALFYPLIPCIAFCALAYWLPKIDLGENIDLYYAFQIAMVGIRCSAVTYLVRYGLHFPEERFYWINYCGSIGIGLFLLAFQVTRTSGYGFMGLYFISVMLAYYRKTESRDSETAAKEKQEDKQIKEEFKPLPFLPRVDGKTCIIVLVTMFSVFWIMGKFIDEQQYGPLKELFVVGMMNFNQDTSIFFFALAAESPLLPPDSLHYIPNLFGLGLLFPGLFLKSFFLILQGHTFLMMVLSYLALHLPSILLMLIYMSFPSHFQTSTWLSIRTSVQYISNGLVLVTVYRMLQQQDCHFNIIAFTSVLIFIITKMYKLYQFISALLGVFLVASRATALHFNHKMTIQNFLCID